MYIHAELLLVKRTHQELLNADKLCKDVHLHLGVAVVYNDAQQNIASPFAQILPFASALFCNACSSYRVNRVARIKRKTRTSLAWIAYQPVTCHKSIHTQS